jgi:hypothetical protein
MRLGIYEGTAAAMKQAGVDRVNTVGYCIGGTLLSATLAHMAAKGDERIASATFFAAQQDFSEAGDLLLFTSEEWLSDLEKQMESGGGVLAGQTMADTFNMLRSNDLIWSFFVSNYLLSPQNVAFIETAGADVTVNYAFEPGSGSLGRFNLRGTLGYLDKLLVLPANGGIVDDNQSENGAPEWVGTADITWTLGHFALNYGVQYVGDQLRFEKDQIAGDPDIAAPEFLTINDRFIHDIRAEIRTDDERANFFLGVNNFTNELPIRGLANQSGVGWLGRYFYAGIRFTTDQLGF